MYGLLLPPSRQHSWPFFSPTTTLHPMNSYYPLYTRGTFSKASCGITCCANVSSALPTIETKWKPTVSTWNIFHKYFYFGFLQYIYCVKVENKRIYICVIYEYIIVLFQTPWTVYSLHSLCWSCNYIVQGYSCPTQNKITTKIQQNDV